MINSRSPSAHAATTEVRRGARHEYPKSEPVFDASRKEHHWGRRKLARDR
jgi:hypothetical protein